MSVGCFMGIMPSYIDEARDSALSFIRAINESLDIYGQPDYIEQEPCPNVYDGHFFGRSALDHHSASCLVKVAELQEQPAPTHLGLIQLNPYRVAFMPTDFIDPLSTTHEEKIWDQVVKLNVGSAPRLLRDLQAVASRIGITLQDGELPDTTAKLINDFSPLFDGDDCHFVEDERTAWLLLYEGARLAIEHRIALSLAG